MITVVVCGRVNVKMKVFGVFELDRGIEGDTSVKLHLESTVCQLELLHVVTISIIGFRSLYLSDFVFVFAMGLREQLLHPWRSQPENKCPP